MMVLPFPLPTADPHAHGTLNPYAFGAEQLVPPPDELVRLLTGYASLAMSAFITEHNLRAALASRAEVGQAVGILVERHHISEPEAFARPRRASNDHNIKLRHLAHGLAETGTEPGLTPR
jgi:ANTAR domain-containing protein